MATSTRDRDAAKGYSFFNPKLRDASYKSGDIYETEKVQAERAEWEITALTLTGSRSDSEEFISSDALRVAIKGEVDEKDDPTRQLRLFIVEDLSRDVIEILGAHLDIEPTFFREHIVDYAWYNVRDRWINHPALNVVTRRQRWLQLRFVMPRYFDTKDSFTEGFKEAECFNVHRRPDDDQNVNSIWDNKDAVVGLTRTRASFWMKSGGCTKYKTVGIILIDPTIKEGRPLWYGYRNWEPTPSVNSHDAPPNPPRTSLYEDLIFWAKRPQGFQYLSDTDPKNAHLPIYALLHLVSAEWLIMCDYIKSRLGQIEWGISYPEHFIGKGDSVDMALKKLHVWRRLVPLYREMLNETMQRVFYFPCNGEVTTDAVTPERSGNISALKTDFNQILSYMEEYQQRIDRLTSVVTAIISIADSRRGQDDNRNMAQLTWLATFFIPLSYIASLFSMQADLSGMGHTYWLYVAIAVPLAIVSLGVARVLTYPNVHRFVKNIFTFGGKA
ncbi:hypothetical protein B7463_g1654, partial [Scytalidium lignicola]